MDNYLEQYKILHKTTVFGKSSEKLYADIIFLVKKFNPTSILDYGCGQSKLVDKFKIKETYRYDPAIEEYATVPENKVELILCLDVLEHIPEKYISSILTNIKSLSDNVIFSIGLQPACTILPDGKNAHCTIKTEKWWLEKIKEIFEIVIYVKNIRNVKFLCKTWK